MFKYLLLVPFLLSLTTVAEPPKRSNPQQKDENSDPAIPAPGPGTNLKKLHTWNESVRSLGDIFYNLEKEMKLQKGIGHNIAGAFLAGCDGEVKDKIQAFKDIDTALKSYGPDIYKTGPNVLRSNGRGGSYYAASDRSITSNSTMSQIVAVLVCKQDNRSANEMAKMLTSAYADAISKEATHPDTKEKLSWSKDLNTLLMSAILMK